MSTLSVSGNVAPIPYPIVMLSRDVNFFGHATMALEQGERGRFVLGSMLPDFAAMVRARHPTAHDAELARGIAFHHATDEAFHDAPMVHALSARSFAWPRPEDEPNILAFAVEQLPTITAWAELMDPLVRDATPTILREVRAGLAR